jgi:hypothetical protein
VVFKEYYYNCDQKSPKQEIHRMNEWDRADCYLEILKYWPIFLLNWEKIRSIPSFCKNPSDQDRVTDKQRKSKDAKCALSGFTIVGKSEISKSDHAADCDHRVALSQHRENKVVKKHVPQSLSQVS